MTFGEFLLQRNALQPEDLLRCLDYRRWLVPFIGTLAVSRGYMGAAQVLKVIEASEHTGRHFGEIAVEVGYLTQPQVDDLLERQRASMEPLSSCLVKLGIFHRSQVETLEQEWLRESEAPVPESFGSMHWL